MREAFASTVTTTVQMPDAPTVLLMATILGFPTVFEAILRSCCEAILVERGGSLQGERPSPTDPTRRLEPYVHAS